MKRTKRRRKPEPPRFTPPSQFGLVNQAGQGNSQTVRLNLVQQLQFYVNSCESLKRELALYQALVAAKEETIALLKGRA